MIKPAILLEKIRSEKPLVHHITNWVTIYDCANVVRSIGALPVMAHAIEESAEMQAISNALVLNIGTLTPELVDSMVSAGKKANELQHAVVLDAVGVGATKLRTEKALEILNSIKVDVVKGNVSEIASLARLKVQTRGVEATAIKENRFEIARELAKEKNSVIVITGKEDVVAGEENYLVKNGHELLGKFVGSGCMAASLIGCFAAVEKNYSKASASALACFGIAGELAAKKAKAPAAFKQLLFDELFNLNAKKIERMEKIEKI